MKAVIKYGKRRIPVTLIKRARRTLAITVNPDRTVLVHMPAGADRGRVIGKVTKKAKWIAKHLDYFEKNAKHVIRKEYVSGETHSYMGRKYRLRVRNNINERIRKSGGFIYLFTNRNGNIVHRKEMLYNWYKWQAEKKFAEILNSRVGRLQEYRIKLPEFYIKKMTSRWGSCSPKKGRINLNLELIKTPRECIEYIIDHELLHFLNRNHDKKYYELLERDETHTSRREGKIEKYIINQ